MISVPLQRERLPFYFAFGAAVAGFVSIAASHILLGAALAALLWKRDELRAPPVWIPLALFCIWTVLSAAVSGHFAAGLPQIKKFYVFLLLPVVYSAIRTVAETRRMFIWMAIAAAASGSWSLVQYAIKYNAARTAGVPFYQAYVADRITGFMSHWMTFSGHMMLGLALLAALMLFAQRQGRTNREWFAWSATGGVMAAGLVLGITRSMWAGAAVAAMYLLWHWRRWVILTTPLLAVAVFVAAPEPLATRIRSFWQPSSLDSNDHRTILRRTGLRMIEEHPWFGVGPMQVKERFLEHLPPDVPRPLPAAYWYDHLHNIYIHFAAERGIPAMLALVTFLGLCLYRFARAARDATPDAKAVLHGAAACLVGVLVAGWGEVNLGDSEILGSVMSIAAGAMATMNDAACHRHPRPD